MKNNLENKIKLTKRIVESAEIHPSKRLSIWDTEIQGFNIRIYPTGRKVYYLQYRNKHHATRKIKIGVHGNISTEQAREAALKFALEVSSGVDPAETKQLNKLHPTVTQLCHEYIELHAKVNKRKSSYEDDLTIIKNVVLPYIGTKKLVEITSNDLQKIHRDLQNTPYMANKVQALLSKMFNLAIQWNWCTKNPTKYVTRYPEQKRNRWLNDEEMDALRKALDSYHDQNIANVYRLLLLTGSRRGEVLNATWDQFDLDKGVWTKPAHTTKQNRMEHLPLSTQVIELLKNMRKASDQSPYLFPGKVDGHPLKEIKKSWATIRQKAKIPDVRIHDLRHTYASHLVSSGLSLSIVGKLLGHTQASTTQRYAHLADEPLRQATEFFGNKVGKKSELSPEEQ